MKLTHYVKNGAMRVGIVNDGLVFDLADAAKELVLSNFRETTSIDMILSKGLLESLRQAESKIIATEGAIPIKSVKLRSPILNPEKILMMAVNYISHGGEQKIEPPLEPYFFTKFRNTLLDPEEPILIPRISKKVDWEVELAVIIGKTGKYIRREDAMNHVAGYTVSNDISFRDLMIPSGSKEKPSRLGLNWVKGKSLDSSFPLGPWLVTKDEIPDPYHLEISLAVNHETKQNSTTEEMVFKIDSLIEYASAGITLKPGDIISTGTPSGVAVFTGQPFLKDGDIVEAQIEKIGTLCNPVRAEK
jgi:2-keto-4-pentenoate hydratase/2-oxohepta-3-ene-1,7-dioic acid hydratase in catechol pathway